ncbi:hypothetical protein HY212_02745 [Candidatus Pacearchaeota archaeon]|nr:hypothetical protein [Candidatus Pacearchaeota archaeon]
MDDVTKGEPPVVMSRIEEGIEERKRGDRILLAQEKRPEELITSIEGYIDSVINYNSQTSHTQSNGIIGPDGNSWTIRTGNINRLEISLSNPNPMSGLTFYGSSPIKKGDKIRAYVVKGEMKRLNFSRHAETNYPFMDRALPGEDQVLVDGPLRGRMEALYLEILEGEEIARTDYSIHYDAEKNKVSPDFEI